MIEAEMTQFVRESLLKGVRREEIGSQLTRAGWSKEKVGEGLAQFAEIDASVPVPRPRPYLSAREAFVYLLLFVTLYISAYNVGAILFTLIESAVPDAIEGRQAYLQQALRWSLASVLIAFPAFLVLSRVVRASLREDPGKRGSKVRKWLTYLTLFVAATTILGDSITLVYYFLGGELTTRFLLKVGVVGLIAGSVFGYYLWDLRGEESADVGRDVGAKPKGLHAAFVWMIVAGVALTVIGGVRESGSPDRARTRSLDLRRVEDLRQIATAVDGYRSRNHRLPASLAELEADRSTVLRSVDDPATEQPYEYRTLGELEYELCAVFDAPSERPVIEPTPRHSAFWLHGAGRVCFEAEAK